MQTGPASPVRAFWRFRLGRLLGLALFIAGLCSYRSYESRVVLGLWSRVFFALIVVATALLLVELLRSFLRPSLGGLSRPAKLLDLAFVSWGTAYLLSARDAAVNGGRIADLNLFGSHMPAAALLEWTALLLLVLAARAFVSAKVNEKWIQVRLAIVTTLFLFLLGEGIARVKVAVAPATQGFPTLSSTVWGQRYVRLNREGWRDAEHRLSAAPGTRRLLVVGDSFAFGWGLRRVEDRVGERLATWLNTRGGAHWESLNASKGDSHTLDEIGYLERMSVYKPNFVMLLYVFNDIDYLAPVTRREGPFAAGRSFLYRFHPLWLVYKNSYLFQEIFVRLRMIYYRVHGDDRPDPYADPLLLSRHMADVARFTDLAKQEGAVVRVVPFDLAVALDPKVRSRYERFVQQASADGVPICSLEKTFDGFSYRDLTVNALDGHPNEIANHLAAEAVALCIAPDTGNR